MTTFGFVLIPFTYLFQHFFKDSNSAFRLVGVVYICLGILVPTLVEMLFGIATHSQAGIMIGRGICFLVDPFSVFYFGI